MDNGLSGMMGRPLAFRQTADCDAGGSYTKNLTDTTSMPRIFLLCIPAESGFPKPYPEGLPE